MNQPSMDQLRERVDSRYTLVAFAAKRARQLLEGAKPLVNCGSDRPVTIALNEIAQDRVGWERTRGSGPVR
ncbi:MAG: DNA-directed RNA polymerase subunit omega [Limnochordia bacterium]|jgi:DNA-directed RNA polymerase subunit omega